MNDLKRANGKTTLLLDDYLEAKDMGKNQSEIAEWVQASDEWMDYVNNKNKEGIPVSDDCAWEPSEEWVLAQEFHPDDLIDSACEALGWLARPTTGGLYMNFYQKGNK